MNYFVILFAALFSILISSCNSTITQNNQGSIGSGSCSARLAWDANTESDLQNYTVYVGTVSGSYGQVAGTPTGTTFLVTGADCGTEYFFVVTASDTSGNESDHSDEVSGEAKKI